VESVQQKDLITVSAPMMSICIRAAVKRDRYSLVGMTVRPSPMVNFFVPKEVSGFAHHGIWKLAWLVTRHTNGQIIQMEHGNTSFHKRSCHLHGMCQSTKTHISIGNNGSQEIPLVQTRSFSLWVQKLELPLSLVLPLLGSKDFVDDRGNGIPRVIGVVHARLADLGVATQRTRNIDGLKKIN